MCRKKWNKIKKSSQSSKFKGIPTNGHLSSDNLLKIKESSTNVELSSSKGLHCEWLDLVLLCTTCVQFSCAL